MKNSVWYHIIIYYNIISYKILQCVCNMFRTQMRKPSLVGKASRYYSELFFTSGDRTSWTSYKQVGTWD